MTPEELNRSIEFIIQSQARLAAAQEQDREDRVQFQKESKAFDRRLAGLLETQVRLLESQTRRLDEYEKLNAAAQKRHEETQRLAEKRLQETEEAQRMAEKRHEEAQRLAAERHEEFLQFMEDSRGWQERFHSDAQKHFEATMASLERILEKLTDRRN